MPGTINVLSGTWSASGDSWFRTSDANAAWRSTDPASVESGDEHSLEIFVDFEATGDSLDVRIAWDTTSGDYLFGRFTVGTACSTIELYQHVSGVDTRLMGPFQVMGDATTVTVSLKVCYDGSLFAFRVSGTGLTTAVITDTSAYSHFTSIGGRYVGVATGSANDYAIDRVIFKPIIKYGDDPNYSTDDVTCDSCPICIEASGIADVNDNFLCLWSNVNWTWDGTAESAYAAVSTSTLTWQRTYGAFDVRRRYILSFGNDGIDPATGNNIWKGTLKWKFWIEDSNNYYYLSFSWASIQLRRVDSSVDTLLGTYSYHGDEQAEAEQGIVLGLSRNRIRLGYYVNDPMGVLPSYIDTELQYDATYPGGETTMELVGTSVGDEGPLIFAMSEDCEDVPVTCPVCTPVDEWENVTPQTVLLEVSGLTGDWAPINGSYIIEKVLWRIIGGIASQCSMSSGCCFGVGTNLGPPWPVSYASLHIDVSAGQGVYNLEVGYRLAAGAGNPLRIATFYLEEAAEVGNNIDCLGWNQRQLDESSAHPGTAIALLTAL